MPCVGCAVQIPGMDCLPRTKFRSTAYLEPIYYCWTHPDLIPRGKRDSERARKGLEMADVCMYMLSNKQFTGEMFRELKKALKLPHGGYKLFIPIINDRDRNNDNICSESVAVMKSVGLHPILFGEEMPVIHARAWEKGKENAPIMPWVRNVSNFCWE